jgi:hypothetical protein
LYLGGAPRIHCDLASGELARAPRSGDDARTPRSGGKESSDPSLKALSIELCVSLNDDSGDETFGVMLMNLRRRSC